MRIERLLHLKIIKLSERNEAVELNWGRDFDE